MSGRALLLLGAGFAVWAAAFVALYALLSVGCRFGWDAVEVAGITLQRLQLVVVFLASLALCAGLTLVLRRRREPRPFLARAAYAAALAATASSVFTFAPVLALSPCH